MMTQFFKLMQIIAYFLKLITKSLMGHEMSKRRLTEMYLDVLFEKSKLPQVAPPTPKEPILLAPERVSDFYVHLPQRFTLLTERELYALISLFKESNPTEVLEIGCFRGGSAYHFLLNSPSTTRIYSVDMTFRNVPGPVLKTLKDSNRFHMLETSSDKLDVKPFIKKFDFIFIDGSHEFADVKSDTLKCLEMLKVGGMIVWDDYSPGYPGVYRWLNEFKDQGHNVLNIQGTSLAFYRPHQRNN